MAGETPDGVPCHVPGSSLRRQSAPAQGGLEVWRLRDPDTGRVQSCELRDDSKVGAGWDVMMLEDAEPVFSRRCVDERASAG